MRQFWSTQFLLHSFMTVSLAMQLHHCYFLVFILQKILLKISKLSELKICVAGFSASCSSAALQCAILNAISTTES